MAVVSTPVLAWVASILTATGVTQSGSLTVTVNNTSGWEVQIPIRIQQSNVSNDPVVNVFASDDGGANYDTAPMTSFALPRVSGGGVTQATIRLPTGQYAIQLLNTGPSSSSFSVLTQIVVTAVNNV